MGDLNAFAAQTRQKTGNTVVLGEIGEQRLHQNTNLGVAPVHTRNAMQSCPDPETALFRRIQQPCSQKILRQAVDGRLGISRCRADVVDRARPAGHRDGFKDRDDAL